MIVTKLAGVVAASAITFGIGAITVPPAWATDSIRVFGEQEQFNGPNGLPYIGYTVGKLRPSSDPVPHNGKLYSAKLTIDGFGGSYPPSIERFGARAESGEFYPSILVRRTAESSTSTSSVTSRTASSGTTAPATSSPGCRVTPAAPRRLWSWHRKATRVSQVEDTQPAAI